MKNAMVDFGLHYVELKSDVIEIGVDVQARVTKKWDGTVVVKVIGRKMYEQQICIYG